MKLTDLEVIAIVTARLRGDSWPIIVRREVGGFEENITAQSLRRSVKDQLFPKAKVTKKKKR